MLALINRNPERFIAGIGAIIVVIATQLLTQGLVTSNDNVNLLHFIIVATPLVVGEIISRLPTSTPPSNGAGSGS